MKNSFGNGDDNEFLNVDLNESKINGPRSLSTDQIIHKLAEKNQTLKRQVTKIENVLSQMKVDQKPRYGISLPEIKPDTVKKQLQNAYKQIKIYQHEIQKRRNTLTGEAAYVEQVNKIEKVYKEKVEIHQRLKREMLLLKHEIKQLTKQLKNDLKKVEYQNLESKLTTDIKYMQEKVRENQFKRAAHISQLQKQRKMIKEMEAEFLKENSHEYLESIKMKIFKPNSLDQNIENEAAKEQSRVSKVESETEDTQDKNVSAFTSLQNDAKLLRKMQTDYENKINLLVKQRDGASERNFKSRNKLLEVQFEIQTIQKSIAELKKFVDLSLFKPKLKKNDEKKKQTAKPKNLSILHNHKFVEHGQITKNGKRFSDRALIGKINSKIIEINFYVKQQTGQFVGLQATYRLDDQRGTIKKGGLNCRLDIKKQQCREQNLKLEGEDYLKTLDLYTSKKRVVGISVVSFRNKVLKAGDVSGEMVALQMKESEYPICFFGSILVDGFQCLGVQLFDGDQKMERENN